jgi:hypothetical protein
LRHKGNTPKQPGRDAKGVLCALAKSTPFEGAQNVLFDLDDRLPRPGS